ncbi:thiolase family protein [Orrella sp. JC864]|uniref:thiolase C-terminal domain-containing protein n=1 Tax=Orrella sp. JC864 TaxID=3120298 RepID=UPI00300A741E
MARSRCAIVGVGKTDWAADWHAVRAGNAPHDQYGYALQALLGAMRDAGLGREDIDGLIVGQSTAYERMAEVAGMDVRWGDQADAPTAMLKAIAAIESGQAETIALVYGSNQRSAKVQYGGPAAMGGDMFLAYVYHAPWGLSSQGALYALTANAYMHQTGMTQAELGCVALAQRQWAGLNPEAILRRPVSIADYLASPFICEPLRLLDYCMVNDGGVALIVTTAERAARTGRAVHVKGIGRYDENRASTSLAPRLDGFYRTAQRNAGASSFAMAGVCHEDIDLFSVYDSFSMHVVLALEGYGYCGAGEAGRFLATRGIGPQGCLPTNTSGGHLSDSYMQGWGHYVECVRQLRGEAGQRQVAGARHAHYTSDIAGKAVSIVLAAQEAA